MMWFDSFSLPLHPQISNKTNMYYSLYHYKSRKDGRVVDYTGLENRRTERCRGFESLSFRNPVNVKEVF